MKKLTQFYIRTWNWWYRSDIASSTNSKCFLNWKFRHPEWKSLLKENSTRHVFLKFSPCFSVKFDHFGEHFFLKTPMKCVYVCLLLDLLISLYFNRKFTRKLHCLHQIAIPPFPRLFNTLCLDSFPVFCQLILYISNVEIISKTISLSNIFRNAEF